MSFYYLLAGHLLGDFAFQTNKIAYKKNKEIKWTLLHVFIITLCIIVMGSVFGLKIIWVAAINGILHFFVDYNKKKINNVSPEISFLYFIGDQLVHIIILFILSIILKEPVIELNSRIIFTILIVLFTIPFSSVAIQFLLKIVEQLKDRSFYVKNEKILGNVNRFCIFISLYMSHRYSYVFILVIFIILILFWKYYKTELKSWMTFRYFIAKMLFELLFASIGFFTFTKLVS
ncbi:MAG: DUF3307 domain-containing protein [Clostridiales bacterium]|nr:DUF3307 domain-containing protein [Clostridiales bacterium]